MIRTYISGKVIEKSKFWVPSQTKRRSPKKAASTSRKRDQNDRDAIKRLSRLINVNFTHGDMHITLKYDSEGMEKILASIEEKTEENILAACEHEATLFRRRVKRELEKLGIEFKYIAVDSDKDGKTGEQARPHHHIIMPRVAYEICCEKWTHGTVDYQILRNQDDYTPLAVYLIKQARRKPDNKKYKTSRNLAKPIVKEEIVYRHGELFKPHGAKLIESSTYDDMTGTHYLRYVMKRKFKPLRKSKDYIPDEHAD